jgi:hypothetical protein
VIADVVMVGYVALIVLGIGLGLLELLVAE